MESPSASPSRRPDGEPGHVDHAPAAGPAPSSSGSLRFVLVLSALVMTVAVAVAVWMYWLGGVLPG